MPIGVLVLNIKQMANSVDPDEMAHYELIHLDLYTVCTGIGFCLPG